MPHPRAAERATCPRIDGHYVPKRCHAIYLALRASGGWASYDRLVVDRLQHTRHERKLRELREINREYLPDGSCWDLVLTRRNGQHNEFLLNTRPRPSPGGQGTLFAPRTMRVGEADILGLLEV